MKTSDEIRSVSEPRFNVHLIDRKNGAFKEESFSTLIEARKYALTHALDFACITTGGQYIYTNISITEDGRAVLSFNY